MGRDKATLVRNSPDKYVPESPVSWVERQLEVLADAGISDRMVSWHIRRPVPNLPKGVMLVRDQREDCGPISGLEAALGSISHSVLLAMAVDMQRVTHDLIRCLLMTTTQECGVVPVVHGQMEPLLVTYPRVAQTTISRQLQAGKYSLQHCLELGLEMGWSKTWQVPDKWTHQFENWNTPSDVLA